MKQRGKITSKKLRYMKENNPNLFRESWIDKQKRLEAEEEERLNRAVTRKGSPLWVDGEVIN